MNRKGKAVERSRCSQVSVTALNGHKTAACTSVTVSGLWSEILTVTSLPVFAFKACSRVIFFYFFKQGTVLGTVNKLSTLLINRPG